MSPVNVAEIVVFSPLVTANGVPSMTVNVSNVELFECIKLIRALLAPALITELNRTPVLVIDEWLCETIFGDKTSPLPVTVLPSVFPEALVASKRR